MCFSVRFAVGPLIAERRTHFLIHARFPAKPSEDVFRNKDRNPARPQSVSQDGSAAEAFNRTRRPSAGALQDGRDVKAGARGGDGNPRNDYTTTVPLLFHNRAVHDR